MICELLTTPVLPRLKLSIRIARVTQFTSSIDHPLFVDWIGLDQ